MRKITVITGASSGMGAEFARQLFFKNESQELHLIARSTEKLNALKAQLESSDSAKNNSTKIKTVPMNLSGKEGVEQFTRFLEQEKSAGEFTVELLINNAGFGTYGPFIETPLERELEMIDLNCTALTGICGATLPYMQKGAAIINVASLAAFLPLGNFAVYAATKAYVLSFSVALCAELKDRGICVSALCPGSVSTDFANVASNGARKQVLHGRDPVKVVAHCLKKARHKKRIILWATKWKFTAFMSRFVGRYLGARYTYKYNKRPYKK